MQIAQINRKWSPSVHRNEREREGERERERQREREKGRTTVNAGKGNTGRRS